jgi:hypothetical protein
MSLKRVAISNPSSTVYPEIDEIRTGILWAQNLWHHKPAPPRLRELIAQTTGMLAGHLRWADRQVAPVVEHRFLILARKTLNRS